MKKISIIIKTKSNLFIGGAPTTFELGGIDHYTVMDYEGRPYIPASSLKGTLRNIVKELVENEALITQPLTELYKKYCLQLQIAAEERLLDNLESDRKERMKRRMERMLENASAEYLFGIEGFNQTPKLLFSDVIVVEGTKKELFSIDSKNTISPLKEGLTATPRTYQTVRPNVTFTGEIFWQNLNVLAENKEVFVEETEKILQECFSLLNEGYYRLGNSGSRGYGRIEICSLLEDTIDAIN